MKLSVIIPVYRVEETLERCLQSVVSQDYAEMEIILVDDGSPDNCPKLCDEWAKRDSRIIVIHKENGGLSDARNAGIDIATGDYITFIDSDDYIAEGTYPTVMAEMEQEYDFLEYSARLFCNSKEEHPLILDDRVYTNMEEYWLKGKAYTHTYAWNKIYRREIFDDVRFPKGILFEDVHTLPQLLAKAKTVATTHIGTYHYVANPNGITATADGDTLAMLLDAHTRHTITDETYYLHVLNIQIDVYRMTGKPIRLKHLSVKNLHKLQLKEKIKATLNNLLGINVLCGIYRAIYLIRL